MNVGMLTGMFPPDDERYSPLRIGTDSAFAPALSPRGPEAIPVFGGPLVLEQVDPVRQQFVVGAVTLTWQADLETAVVWATNLLADDDRPFSMPTSLVSPPREDGSIVLITREYWAFPAFTVLKLRPLRLADRRWLGSRHDNLRELAQAVFDGRL
jgi:hypothetical protein